MTKSSSRVVGLLQWVITLLVPVLITLASVFVFMSDWFVQWQYSRPDFPDAQLFTREERLAGSIATLRYVRGELSLDELRGLGVYNEREIRHLVDVQVVTRNAFIVASITLVLLLIALFVLWRSPLTRLNAAVGLLNGGVLTLVLVAAVGLFSAVAFDRFFVTFHRIFFEGDTWLFNLTDTLIQFYPLPFWMTAAYGIASFVFVGGLLAVVLGWWLKRRERQKVLAA